MAKPPAITQGPLTQALERMNPRKPPVVDKGHGLVVEHGTRPRCSCGFQGAGYRVAQHLAQHSHFEER